MSKMRDFVKKQPSLLLLQKVKVDVGETFSGIYEL